MSFVLVLRKSRLIYESADPLAVGVLEQSICQLIENEEPRELFALLHTSWKWWKLAAHIMEVVEVGLITSWKLWKLASHILEVLEVGLAAP